MTEKKIAENAKTNPKRFWKYSQSKLKTRASIPDLDVTDKEGNTTKATDDQTKANHFQDYFGGVFTDEPDGELPEFVEKEYDKNDDIVFTQPIM